ncbi:hypothetical protein [Thermodesulfatator atlanticus]
MGKKLLMVLMAVFLLASGAYAADVKFKGSMTNLVGTIDDNDGVALGDDAGFGFTRLRFQVDVASDDGLAKIVYAQEVGATEWGATDGANGKGFKFGGDTVNIETRFAYAQVALGPGFVRLGLQPASVNTYVWDDTGAGLTYTYKDDCISLFAGVYPESNGGIFDSAPEAWVVKGDYKVDDTTTLGGFFVYNDQTGDASRYYLGFTGSTTIDPVALAWDVIYEGGEENANVDRSAWLLHVNAGVKVDDQLKVSGAVLYATGDNNPSDDKNKTFDFFEEGDAYFGILTGDSMLSAWKTADFTTDYGYLGLMADATYQIDDKSNVRGAVVLHRTAKDTDNDKKDIGTEFDVWYNYKYNKNVCFRIEAAYLISGDALVQDADNVFYAGAGVKFKF